MNKMPVKIFEVTMIKFYKENELDILLCIGHLIFGYFALHFAWFIFKQSDWYSFFFNQTNFMKNRHVYKSTLYNRNKGVLTKTDFEFMRELLERQLIQLQQSDRHDEIDQLKQLFIRLDHQIQRM